MPTILDYNGDEADRAATVASIIGLKSQETKFIQVTANSEEEAAAAEAAGIEMVVSFAANVPAVRAGSSRVFVTAAIDRGTISLDDYLGAAFTALSNGADAIVTARRLDCVRLLVDEDIPVMGHLGFVPKKSTLYGGIRAVGKTASEATSLWEEFQALEDAGAFAVECELIPANVMRAINECTQMPTVSLGSGPDTDVMFLFSSDICGEGSRVPRHARAYGELSALQAKIQSERVRALSAFRADVANGGFPNEAEVVRIDDIEFEDFVDSLDADQQTGGPI